MKVITDYPVIVNKTDITPDLYLANAEGDDDFYNAGGKRKKRSRGQGTVGSIAQNLFSKEAIAGRQKNRAEKRRLAMAKGDKKTTKVVEKTPVVEKEEIKVEEKTPVVVAPITQTPTPEPPKGMSKGAKIGIIVGVVAVLGIVGFMIYKKGKK